MYDCDRALLPPEPIGLNTLAVWLDAAKQPVAADGQETWSKTVAELFRNTHSTTGIAPSRCAALLHQRNLSSYFLCANARW